MGEKKGVEPLAETENRWENFKATPEEVKAWEEYKEFQALPRQSQIARLAEVINIADQLFEENFRPGGDFTTTNEYTVLERKYRTWIGILSEEEQTSLQEAISQDS